MLAGFVSGGFVGAVVAESVTGSVGAVVAESVTGSVGAVVAGSVDDPVCLFSFLLCY